MKSRKNVYHVCSRGLAFIAMLFLLGARAMALTPAGTEIRNQSVATYRDANNQPQISTSNEVINIVAKVYGLEITPNKDPENATPFNYADDPALEQTTAPGNVAYFHYYLKNTGNTPDTYNLIPAFDTAATPVIPPTKIEVYYDANGNGRVDAGDILLRSHDGATLNTAVATPIVAQDATIPLIVAVHTPTSAADTNTIHTDINAASVGSGNPATGIDQVSNWNRTNFSKSTGILTATKGANVNTAKPGDTLTYTVEGSNTGSAAVFGKTYTNLIALDGTGALATHTGILIIDELDPDKLVVDSTYTGSAGTYGYGGISDALRDGPTKAKIVYWKESDETWYDNPTHASWTGDPNKKPKIALFIPADAEAPNPVLTPGQGYKFSFKIEVRSPYDPAQPKLIKNQVDVKYYTGSTDGTEVKTESNESMVTVGADPSTATPGVAIGPYGHPMSETDGDYPITHALATTGLNVEGTGWPNRDTTTAGTRNAGEVISFPVTIRNPNVAPVPNHSVGGPATAADVYNISYVNPDSTQFSVVLFKSDGTTPLADTNGDGKPDTGALEPGADANIIVKVFIKADASDTNSNTFTINAHSSNKPSLFDPTYLLIEAVRPAGVDIAKRDTLGLDNNTSTDTATGQDDDATTAVGANAKVPGDVITFNVDIGNMRPEGQSGNAADEETSVADTYKLSFEKLAGASDFVVHLFEDANNNHTIDADELVPISDTGWLESVADVDALTLAPIFKLNVRVQVPMGTPAGTYYIRVTATSTNNSGISDTMRLAIQVKDAPAIEITPDNTATVIPGGSYIFPHVVTNTGNAESDVTMTYTFPAGTLSGYNAVWVDADGAVLGTGDSCPTGVIAAGASKNIYLKVFVPANAPSGSVVPITVKADMDSFDEADYPASVDTALDIITVIDGALQLTKSNNPTGDVIPNVTEIEYTTVYKNLSAGTLTTTYIADAIPAHTYLIDGANKITAKKPNAALSINAEDDATEFEYSTDGGATWANFSPAPTNFKEVTNIRVNIGAVPAGQSGEFVFKVKVK